MAYCDYLFHVLGISSYMSSIRKIKIRKTVGQKIGNIQISKRKSVITKGAQCYEYIK